MTLEQLEAEVLALPKDAQVILLARLLERLGQESEIDQEITAIWVEEAQKRDDAMNTNQITGIPAEEVFRRIRASLTMTRIVFHLLAEQELVDATSYYEEKNQGLGLDFLTEVEGAVNLLMRYPAAGVVVRGFVRRLILPKFPYSLWSSTYISCHETAVCIVCDLGWAGRSHPYNPSLVTFLQ